MEACHQELISPALRQAGCDAKRSTGTESLRKLAYHFCDLLWCCLVGCGSNAEHCHASIEHNFAASEPPSEQSTIPSIHSEPESSKAILKTPPFLTRAADKGVFFRLSFNEELAGNPSGRDSARLQRIPIYGYCITPQVRFGLTGLTRSPKGQTTLGWPLSAAATAATVPTNGWRMRIVNVCLNGLAGCSGGALHRHGLVEGRSVWRTSSAPFGRLSAGQPDGVGAEGYVGPPAVRRAGEEIGMGFHPTPVDPQGLQQLRT